MAVSTDFSDVEWGHFHQTGVLCGIWLMNIFVGSYALGELRAVLIPLFCTFFLMMGLIPAVEAVERAILHFVSHFVGFVACCCRKVLCLCAFRRGRQARCCEASMASSDESSPSEEDEAGMHPHLPSLPLPDARKPESLCLINFWRSLARFVSVMIVVGSLVGLLTLLAFVILDSAKTMRNSWFLYRSGAKRIANDVNELMQNLAKLVPPSVVEKIMTNILGILQALQGLLLQPLFKNVAGTLVELIMTLLYMVFWLCQPIQINRTVAKLFKRYILMKSAASFLYAVCVWLLLWTLNVELAVVFALCSFLLNFVPDLGPLIAAALPAPVILFDGRLVNPWATLGICLAGELGLKFLFGSIIEVKLIRTDNNMRMHPVAILFCMAFFGNVWGPTGMLLAVPLMAALKAVAKAEALPPQYCEVLLWFLEGNRPKAGKTKVMVDEDVDAAEGGHRDEPDWCTPDEELERLRWQMQGLQRHGQLLASQRACG